MLSNLCKEGVTTDVFLKFVKFLWYGSHLCFNLSVQCSITLKNLFAIFFPLQVLHRIISVAVCCNIDSILCYIIFFSRVNFDGVVMPYDQSELWLELIISVIYFISFCDLYNYLPNILSSSFVLFSSPFL